MTNRFLSTFLPRFAVVANNPKLGGSCPQPVGGTFLGIFPTWYHYLPGFYAYPQGTDLASATSTPPVICAAGIRGINDVWLVVAAVVEILLRLAAVAAVIMIIYGGISFIVSQGEPEKIAKARSTLIYALIGLAIAVSAAAIVTFLAGQFKT